jgi:Autophagocytosis associated protein, active-site domain
MALHQLPCASLLPALCVLQDGCGSRLCPPHLLWRPALQAALPTPAQDNIKRTRTYDLLISYDKFHSVPCTWLVGYDEDRQPLKPEQVQR